MPDLALQLLSAEPPHLLAGLAGVLALLIIGTLAGALLSRLNPGKDYANLRQRVRSWWIMAALLAAALLLGWPALTLLFAVVSFIALREFLSLAPMAAEDRPLMWIAYLAILVNYALVVTDRYGIYLVFIPVWLFLITPFLMACIGQTRRYLPRAAIIHGAWSPASIPWASSRFWRARRPGGRPRPGRAAWCSSCSWPPKPTTWRNIAGASCWAGARSCPRSVPTRRGRASSAAG
jgi:hypothetical protein